MADDPEAAAGTSPMAFEQVRIFETIPVISFVTAMLFIVMPACSADGKPFVYQGKPRFAYGFSSHIVLQRDTGITVWGFADCGTPVTIAIGNQRVTARANECGKWLATLAAMPAGGPHSLILQGGDTRIELTDVLVDDVWICSGQANMRYGLARKNLNATSDCLHCETGGLSCPGTAAAACGDDRGRDGGPAPKQEDHE